jgi:hypothetical protein
MGWEKEREKRSRQPGLAGPNVAQRFGAARAVRNSCGYTAPKTFRRTEKVLVLQVIYYQ